MVEGICIEEGDILDELEPTDPQRWRRILISPRCPSGKAIDVTMTATFVNVLLHVWEVIIHCCFFGHARREQLGLCKPACAPSDDFFKRGDLGGQSSANYEHCHVPLENCCFDAALMLLYGIRSRHANASRHCQITMRCLLNLKILWWNISLRNVQLSSSRRHGLKTRSGMSECETGMVRRSNHAAEKQNGEMARIFPRVFTLDDQNYTQFFFIEVTVKWRRFSSPGRRFSAMPKWRSLRTNDGGLTCMLSIAIYTAESPGASIERTKMPNLRNGSKGGFEPGLTLLRVRRSMLSYRAPLHNISPLKNQGTHVNHHDNWNLS